MSILTSVLVSTGVPILLDLVKSAGGALSRRLLGLSVDDQIKLEQASVERIKALAELDNPYGTPSQWVVDLRGSFRYVCAGLLVVSGVAVAVYGAVTFDQELVANGFEMAAAPFGFIFGERLVLTFKGGPK